MDEYITNAFTKQEDKVNLEVNNLNLDCMTSKNNKFELDVEGNLSVKSLTADQILSSSAVTMDILNSIYPIGSVYISVLNSNPSVLFGGTWEQIKDKFLLSCGDNYINGSVGGEATHQLTNDEMPSHSHADLIVDSTYVKWDGTGNNAINLQSIPNVFTAGLDGSRVRTSDAGGGQAHNNMPPYLAVYVWKRIQ